MAIASGRSCQTKMFPPTRTDSSQKLRQYLKANKRTLLNQMVNPDVRDDMPIADFTAASSSRRFGPPRSPHKQKYHNLGFSSVIVADVTNVGDPRLVIPVHIAHAAQLVCLFEKKRGPTWETHDWPVVPYTLNGLSLAPRLLCCLFPVGVFCFRVWWQRLERCQRHLAMAPVAVMLNLRADTLTAGITNVGDPRLVAK